LEGKLLLSSAIGHDSSPRPARCPDAHFIDLNGSIKGFLTPAGSTVQIVSSTGNLEAYGKVKATGSFAITPSGTISAGQMGLSGRAGSIELTLVATKRWHFHRNNLFALNLTTGQGTGRFAHHCSKGSVLVAVHEKRSHFVASLTTVTLFVSGRGGPIMF
jgi:hypothetical protein